MLSRKRFLYLTSTFSLSTLVLNEIPFAAMAAASKPLKRLPPAPAAGSFIPTDLFNNYQIVRDNGADHLMIFAADFEISPGLFGTDRNITIFSFKTKITGEIRLAGKNFFLLSDQIEVSPGTIINVSGNNGQDFSGGPPLLAGCNATPNTAPASQNINDQGVDESDRSGPTDANKILGMINGTSSGNVYVSFMDLNGPLAIHANGGNGGKGQDGSQGINGCPTDVNDTDGIYWGHPGENGGNGAFGGYGGNAGQLITSFSAAQFGSSVTLSNALGTQGSSGAAGGGGNGTFGHLTPNYDKIQPKGEPRIHPNLKARNGVGGVSPVNDHSRDGKAAIAANVDYFKYIPVEYVLLMMIKAESLYLNKDAWGATDQKYLEDLLSYIYTIAGKNADKGYYDAANATEISTYLFFQQQDNYASAKYDDEWKSLQYKAVAYLQQLKLGQDVFGNPLNYAPNLDADFFLSRFAPDKSFSDYYKATATKQDLLNDADVSASNYKVQCQANISQVKSDIDAYINTINSLNAEVQNRFKMIEILKANLGQDDMAFRTAVESQGGGCNLDIMIHALIAVVAIVAAIYTLGTTSEAAVVTVGEVIADAEAVNSLSQIADVVTAVKDLSSDMDKIEDNFDKLKKAYNELNTPVTQNPTTLINVDRAKFDQTIDKFLSLPAAQKYKADYHNFLDYVDLTNQKRLAISAAFTSLNAANQTLAALQAQLSKFDDVLVDNKSTVLSNSDKLAMFNLFYKTKWMVAQEVYLQNKALAYQYPARPAPLTNYDVLSIETLTSDSFQIGHASLLNLDTATFHYPSDNNLKPLSISFADYPASQRVFPKLLSEAGTGNEYFLFEFKLTPPMAAPSVDISNDPLFLKLAGVFDTGMTNIKVMGLQVALKGKNVKPKKLTVRFGHLGNSTVTTAPNFQGQKMFSHSPKEVDKLMASLKSSPFKSFSEQQKTNLVGVPLGSTKASSLGVSPFATWQLKIYWLDNQDLSVPQLTEAVKGLTGLDLLFWYYYQ